MMQRVLSGLGLVLLAGPALWAQSGRVTDYSSPSGVAEQCIALESMPSAVYSDDDRREEDAFCSVDFYADTVAICPKIWSTSPATMVHDVSRGEYAGRARDFEAEICPKGTRARDVASGELATYKITMNASDTSATFSTASLLYYHFSRYFDSDVYVPVAVYRSMDKQVHHDRVAVPGIRLTKGSSSLKMVHAAWRRMVTDEETPGKYQPSREVFTPDRSDVFGVLLTQEGRRYSEVINGTRESGWGDGQNRDFQRTPAFTALSTDGTLAEAIAAGRRTAQSNRKFSAEVNAKTPDAQFVFWMKELTEITLLDYIFSQQDRIGNIDYVEYWYWGENQEVKRQRAHGGDRPEGVPAEAIRLKRTHLNDNDAGGRVQYVNYTKRTGMLEKIRHYSPETYSRLIKLNEDFKAQGPLYQYVKENFGLSSGQLQQVVKNTDLAVGILQGACSSGKLHFDLDPEAVLLGIEKPAAQVECGG